MVALAGLFGSVAAASPRLAHADSSPSQTQTTFESGATLSYGVTLSLLQFSTVRSPDEPARYRNYAPKLEVLPTEINWKALPSCRLRRQGENCGL